MILRLETQVLLKTYAIIRRGKFAWSFAKLGVWSMRFELTVRRALTLAGAGLIGFTALITHPARAAPADLVYRNGYVYTVDATDSVQQALAIRKGRIVYVGDDAGIDAYIGRRTHVVAQMQSQIRAPYHRADASAHTDLSRSDSKS
jgi:hypothetical protein